jgi:16S rRNA (guanine527-N7)-methyltransferase
MAHKNKTNVSPYKSRTTPQNQLRGQHKKPQKIYSIEEANDRLYDIFKNHGLKDFPHAERRKLAEFYVLLMENQARENFTRLLTIKDIGIKHFIDCLIVPEITELKFPLLDLGTGPGFPGIPLKIKFQKETIILAEGVQRRVEFLKQARESLELQHLPIVGRNINPEFLYPVNGVITRAVEDIRNTLSNVIHCLQPGGLVYFMKGPGVDPEIELAASTHREWYRLVENKEYDLPHTDNHRRLVIYEKIKSPILNDDFFESLGLGDNDDDE